MKKILYVFYFIISIFNTLHSQVGIGTDSPNTSAILDVSSSDKGVLLPRVTSSSAISNKEDGMIFYDTESNCVKTIIKNNISDCLGLGKGSQVSADGEAVIASLDCANAVLNKSTLIVNSSNIATISIPYSGGNGETYGYGLPIASTGITGLTAVLRRGVLTTGTGYAVFDVTGIPSGTGTAIFNLSFLGFDCIVNYPVIAAGRSIGDIAAGMSIVQGICSEGVWSQGTNDYGTFGTGNATNSDPSIPAAAAGNGSSNVTAIDNGYNHSVILNSSGAVFASGNNSYGQLGNGSSGTNISSYTPVSGLSSGVIAIEAGQYSSYAIKSDGTLWAWGLNNYGQLGDGTTVQKTSPVQASLPPGRKAVQVSSSVFGNFALVLLDDNTVVGFGYNNNGQLGDGTTTNRSSYVYVKDDSGNNFSNVLQIATGTSHSLAIVNGGAVYSWGAGNNYQMGNGTNPNLVLYPQENTILTSDVIQIDAQQNVSYAVTLEGKLYSWGTGGGTSVGDLGQGATGGNALNVSPTPAFVLSNKEINSSIGVEDVASVKAGYQLALFKRKDGSLWAFGINSNNRPLFGTHVGTPPTYFPWAITHGLCNYLK